MQRRKKGEELNDGKGEYKEVRRRDYKHFGLFFKPKDIPILSQYEKSTIGYLYVDSEE